MLDYIKYKLTPLINKCKEIIGKRRTKHIKKKSKLDKDVVLGILQTLRADHIKEGVKVLTPKGIGFIKEIFKFPYVRVSHLNRTCDYKKNDLKQIFFSVYNKKTDELKVYPLSYADYEYIKPNELQSKERVYLEGHITNKRYYQLTDALKEEREYLTVFNKSKHSQDVYLELKEKQLLTKIK